jgi:hypothetical protein
MANFCLPRDRVSAFQKAIKSGELDPPALAQLSSVQRRDVLAKFVGEEAAPKVNAEFESKLLLKNQKQGMVTWVKGVTNMKPEVRRDMLAKIQKLERMLDPEDKDVFFSDLAEKRLGFGIDAEEVKLITGMSKKVSDLEAKRLPDRSFPTFEDRMAYGYAAEDLSETFGKLKIKAESLKLSDLKTLRGLGSLGNKIAGNMKSLTASMDNSSIFRQGWKTMITNPNIWRKNATDTFITIARTIGGKNVMREVNAEIISRPMYDKMVKAGLAIKNPEEAFPESLAERIPGFGRLYKASESAYTGFVYKMRADVFEQYIKAAEHGGVNINNPTKLKSIGNLVNSLTGRGNLGRLEPIAGVTNNLFFSPRFLKSNIDTLTAHQFDKNVTPFVRKQAAKNLLKISATVAGILATADAISPGSVDFDSRSTDFGKIKVGNTRFDVTGGMASLVTLGARLVPTVHDGKLGFYAKTSTGKMQDLQDEAFGSRDQIEVLTSFIRNKLSPAAALVTNLSTGEDTLGNPTTPIGELVKGVTPIGARNAYEALQDPNSAPDLAIIIADGLGISANNYVPIQKNAWKNSTTKELNAFKEKVGDKKFEEAGKQFEKEANAYINRIVKDERYTALNDDDKQSLLARKKAEIRTNILKKYNFTYKKDKSDPDKLKDLLK